MSCERASAGSDASESRNARTEKATFGVADAAKSPPMAGQRRAATAMAGLLPQNAWSVAAKTTSRRAAAAARTSAASQGYGVASGRRRTTTL